MTTLTAATERLADVLQVGLYGTADSRSATALTHVANLGNTIWPANTFRGWWIHSSLLTGNDEVKPAGTLSAGVLQQVSGTSWSNTTDKFYYRLWRPEWHPTRYVRPLMNRALEKAWQWWRDVLTPIPDGNVQSTATISTLWSTANATPTKDTSIVWSGKRSLKVANSAVNGYSQSNGFVAAPNRSFRLTAKVYAATGTPKLTLYDLTNSAVIDSVTATAPASAGIWEEIMLTGSFPSTCYKAAVRVGGVGASDATYWSDLTIYPDLSTQLDLPSWLTAWRTQDGDEAARVLYERNRLGSSGDWAAKHYDLALVNPDKYQIIQQPSAVNSLQIELGREVTTPGWPLVLEGRRSFADVDGSMSADTDASGIPLQLWVAAAKSLAADERSMPQRQKDLGGNGQFEAEYVMWQKRVQSALRTPVDGSVGMAYQVMR